MKASNITDEELIRNIRAGGPSQGEYIRKFYKQHFGFVYKLAKEHKMLSLEEIRDVYTDSVIIFRDHILNKQFEQKSKASVYFFTILSRKCIDVVRHKTTNKSKWSRSLLNEMPLHLKDPSANPDEQLIRAEEIDHLRQCLDQLGDVCRQVLKDWAYEGFNMEKIAERSGLKNAPTARSKKYYCLQQLKEIIKASKRHIA